MEPPFIVRAARPDRTAGLWVALALLWGQTVAPGALPEYDAAIERDAAGGLTPTARLNAAVTLTGANRAAWDFGPVSGDATLECIVAGDPTVQSAYLAVGVNSVSNLRYAQWPGMGQLGFTQLGVRDYTFTPSVTSPVEPTHLTFAWNESERTLRLYRNGTLAGTATAVEPGFAMPTGPGWLGTNPGGSESMVGTIHRVTVYDDLVAGEVIRAHADAFTGAVRPPAVLSFTASPPVLFRPTSATLAWDVRAATKVYLDGRDVTGQSTLVVTPDVTTTYTLVASNAAAMSEGRVTVLVDPAPAIRHFASSRGFFEAGDVLTLDWGVDYASRVTLDPLPGDVTAITVNGVGSVRFQPAESQRYVLTAQNAFGTAQATIDLRLLQPAHHLVIAEFLAENRSSRADEDGEYSGWIEILNPTTQPVNLAGYALTDDPANPTRWSFPSTNLAPKAQLLVFASGKNRGNPGRPLHTNFRLKQAGEFLALTGPGPSWLHTFAPAYPRQRPDVSYGIQGGDPGTPGFMGVPTPGTPNNDQPAPPAPVEISSPGGTFTNTLTVTLTGPDPVDEIRFTLDGSTPGPTNGTRYTTPVQISQSTRLRAVSLNAGLAGPVTGASYVRLASNLVQYASPLPILIIENFGAGPIRQKGWNGTGAGIRQVPRQTATWATFERVAGSSSLTQPPQMLGLIGIRGRGAYSTEWRQKPYSVEAIDEDGTETAVSPLGMPAHSDWVLYFPDAEASRDPALLFNTFAYELSRSFGDYAARFRWVEAFVNEDGGDLGLEDRRGIYALVERVSRGEDRLDFEKLSADGSSGGWLLNINRMDPEPEQGWPAPNGAVRPWFFHTAGPDGILQSQPDTAYASVPGDDQPQQSNGFINFDNPNGYVLTTRQRAAIEQWFRQFEGVLYDNAVWRDPIRGYRQHLDTRNFIDYFVLNTLTRNGDGLLISIFPWKGDDGRLRIGPAWDYNWSAYYVSGGPTGSLLHRSERLWYPRLFSDPDFMQSYVDRWWELRQGPLSNAAMTAIVDRQAAEITPAKSLLNGMPSTAEWTRRLDQLKNWLRQRADWIDSQYPTPPSLNQPGGAVPDGFQVVLTGTGGTLFVTTDGSDPRAPGGGVATGARIYGGPISLQTTTVVRARLRKGTTWSALVSAVFETPRDLAALELTELMYHPPSFGVWTSDDLEFVELKNRGAGPLVLDSLGFTGGITFTFTNGTRLDPGAFFLLARNLNAFQARYPGVPVNGVYGGRLDNGGESLRLSLPSGRGILEVAYNDRTPWPLPADGHGFSLVPRDSGSPSNSSDGARWRASAAPSGSPGADDPAPSVTPVLINEVLTHTTPPDLDAVELFNPTTRDVELGGWFLSDDGDDPRKFRFPDGTVLRGGEYRVLTEADFNPQPGDPRGFLLSAAGESLYLCAADSVGRLTGYSHGVDFGAAPAGGSLGRHVDSAGAEHFALQVTPTLGAPNAGPRIGPVVVSEILPDAESTGDAFVELRNITDQPVPFFDPAHPTNTWRLTGIGFGFPENFILPARGLVLVVATNPAAFRIRFSVPEGVPVLGPFPGNLQAAGDHVALRRPEFIDPVQLADVTVDEVAFTFQTPWPPGPYADGTSLQRLDLNEYGNDPAHWTAAAQTPGTDLPEDLPPNILTHPVSQGVVAGNPVTLSVSVNPKASLPILYRWQRHGVDIPGGVFSLEQRSSFLTVNHPQPPFTDYRVIVANSSYPDGLASQTATLNFLDDADHDGMADDWELAHGFSPANPEDPDLDRDGDGMLNAQEFQAGTDPADPLSFLKLEASSGPDGVGILLRFRTVAGRTYSLEHIDALENGPWSRLMDLPAEAVDRSSTLVDPAPMLDRYYRLVTPRRP